MHVVRSGHGSGFFGGYVMLDVRCQLVLGGRRLVVLYVPRGSDISGGLNVVDGVLDAGRILVRRWPLQPLGRLNNGGLRDLLLGHVFILGRDGMHGVLRGLQVRVDILGARHVLSRDI